MTSVPVWPLAAVFMVHAGVMATWGPRTPAIKERLGIDDGGLAVALAGLAVGMFVGTRLAGALMRRFGPRPVVQWAVVVLGVTLVGPAVAPGLVGLTAALVLMGLTMGVMDVAMNAEAIDIERRVGRPVIAGLHGAWSGGMLLAGGIAALAAAGGIVPLVHFVVMAVVFVGIALVAGARLPVAEVHQPAVGAAAASGARRGDLRIASVALLGIVAASSFAAEGAANDWSAVYLHDRLGASEGAAAFGFVAFAVGMMIARLLTDRVIARVDMARLVAGAGLLGAAGVGLVVAAPSLAPEGAAQIATAIVGLAVMGIAFAPVVPIVFRVSGSGRGGHRRLGWVVTLGYLGTMAGPAIIGLLASVRSLQVGLTFVAALGLVIALVAPSALRRAARD